MVYLADLPLYRPEFSHLQAYDPPPSHNSSIQPDKPLSLRERIKCFLHADSISPESRNLQIKTNMTISFLDFLSNLLGWSKDIFDRTKGLATYGIDSLSGVSCQYWFHRGMYPISLTSHLISTTFAHICDYLPPLPSYSLLSAGSEEPAVAMHFDA